MLLATTHCSSVPRQLKPATPYIICDPQAWETGSLKQEMGVECQCPSLVLEVSEPGDLQSLCCQWGLQTCSWPWKDCKWNLSPSLNIFRPDLERQYQNSIALFVSHAHAGIAKAFA